MLKVSGILVLTGKCSFDQRSCFLKKDEEYIMHKFKKLFIVSVVAGVFFSWTPALIAGAPMKGLSSTYNQLWSQDSIGIPGTGAAGDSFGAVLAVGDFNGDGCDDLAVGAPYKTINGKDSAGSVNVIYGSHTRLRSLHSTLWHQDITGIGSSCEKYDNFGRSLAAADFNNDGYDDLVIGVPGEEISGKLDAGVLHVLFGSATGLTATGAQYWNENSAGMQDSVEEGDAFAGSLAAGHFDGDAYADLAVGVISEDVNGKSNAGAVHILYGSASGLSSAKDQIWNQNIVAIGDTAEKNDYFGTSLLADDLNGDKIDDLVIGVPEEDYGTTINAGAIHVIYGSARGLDADDNRFWFHNNFRNGTVKKDDYFGCSLTSGDFDNDGYNDLAIGIRGKGSSSGAMQTVPGSVNGLRQIGSRLWHQNINNVGDKSETNDQFGYSLAAGNFDGDGCADLAVGVPYESLGTDNQIGMVHELHGVTGRGLEASINDHLWSHNTPGLSGTSTSLEHFALALVSGDFNDDGAADLAIGVPNGEVNGKRTGSVRVLYGVPSAWDAGYTDVGNGWRQLPWLDYYAPLHNDWYNHNEHGFVYVAPISNPSSMYIYTLDTGWLWTSSTQYPYLYRFSDNSWLWYLKGSDNPRWFKNLTSDKWENVTD